MFFNVNQDVRLIKVFKSYCDKFNLEYETMQFLYDGVYVKGERHTPKMVSFFHD